MAAGMGIYVPEGTYKITQGLDTKGKTIRGAGIERSIIVQFTSTEPVLYVQGESNYVADLTLRHDTLPVGVNMPQGVGVRMQRIGDGSVFERLRLVNHTAGFYCQEPYEGADPANFVYSTSFRDMRFARFTKYAMYLRAGQNSGNTGCVFQNLYATNWDDFATGTKLTADGGFFFGDFDEGVAMQLNVEHGLYSHGVVANNCANFNVRSVHFEGYEANANFDGFLGVFTDRAKGISFENVSIVSCTIPAAMNSYALLKVDDNPVVRIRSVVTRENAFTSLLKPVFGGGTTGSGAAVYLDQIASLDGLIDRFGSFFPISPPVPILRQYNDSREYWQEAAKSRLAGTAPPAAGNWQAGDIMWNTAPAEQGAAGSKYNILGWVCITAGTPGTWLPMRVLTGN